MSDRTRPPEAAERRPHARGIGDRDGRHTLFIERLLIVVAFGLIVALLWLIRQLLVVVMGAIALAVLLRSIASPLAKHTGLGARAATALAVLLLAAVIAALGWLFGSQVLSQLSQLRETLPQSWEALREQLSGLPLGQQLINWLKGGAMLAGNLTSVVMMAGNAVAGLLLIVFGGVFFAAQPGLYVGGTLKLLPEARRGIAGEALTDAGRALRLWLLGQLISMTVVGLLTGLGLWFAGVSSPVALGLIAGVTEGIPYLGPIIGSVPGLLMALIEGPTTAFWALLVYVAVQQIEGNTLVPLIHRKMVSLPPALTLFWIVAAGTIFGIVGLIFATPLLVVLYVMVKRLYVRETLDTDTPVPGEKTD